MSHLVLIVDDHADNRRIYTAMLLHLGYRVIEAEDGEAALALVRSARPDVVLMDMGLPGRMDGWAATAALKGDEATAGVPVIALTAHALPEHETRAAAVGCAAFLAKPVEPRTVAEQVRKVLEG